MPLALSYLFFWQFTAYRALARSLIGTDFQVRLDYFAFLRDVVSLHMTALNVRSNLICAGDSLHTRFIITFSSCGQLRRGTVLF